MRKSHLSIRLIALSLCAVLALLPIAGCSSSDVQNSVDTAAQITDVWSQFLMGINPVAGGQFASAAQALRDAGKTYADYQAADKANKGQVAGELKAALSAIQGNLTVILSDARIHDKDKLEYITAAVAVVNTTVLLILSKLPAPAGITVTQAAQINISDTGLPRLPASVKTVSDVKAYWNGLDGLPAETHVK